MNYRYLPLLLFLVLTILFTRFGFIPAWNNINSDFPNYYTSSRLLTEGNSLSNIYDDKWFQGQINEYGINEKGKFSPFPPPTVFVMVPLTFLTPLTAKRIFILLNLAALFITAGIFKKISGISFINCLNIILLSGSALINNFLFGQLYLLILFLIVLGYYNMINGKEYSAGILWGIGAAVKYFPIIYIPMLIIQKKWKAVYALMLSIIIINVLAYISLGSGVYSGFFSHVLFSHLNGNLSSQSNFAISFQSWNSLLRILFIYDPVWNKFPLLNSPLAFQAARFFVYLLFASVTGFVLFRIRNSKDLMPVSASLMTITLFVLTPASATYHLLLLSFPLILLLKLTSDCGDYKLRIFFIVIYILIGVLPFAVNKLLPEGNLIFSFYRLWLEILFYLGILLLERPLLTLSKTSSTVICFMHWLSPKQGETE